MWLTTEIETKWIVLLAALFVAAGALAAEKAYISVDESGVPEASDRPPAAGTVEEVIELPKTPQQPEAAKAHEDVKRINQMTDQMAAERNQKQNERAVAKDEKERQRVSCAASRSRLQQLESQPPNRRLVAEPDGTTRRVSAEEMQALLEAARRQVVADCGGLDAPAAETAKRSAKPSSGSERNKSPGSSERQKSSGSSERKTN